MPHRGENYLSKAKLEALKFELAQLENEGRREIARRLEYGKSLGDLSENAEYQEAREAQTALEERISKLHFLIKNAVIVEVHHSAVAELGSTVLIRRKGDQQPKKYHIVGSEEASIGNGKISNESPMGSALLGKKKGDVFEVRTPKGHVSYEIVDFE